MKRIESIQALRGIAAVMVILCHCRWHFCFGGLNVGEMIFSHGAMGVDLFFIISGFIMTITTAKTRGISSTPADFFIKRIARILPLYWAATSMYVFFDRGPSWFVQGENIGVLIKSFLWVPANLHGAPPEFGHPPMGVGWTLNYEMLFYLIFGISLFFKEKRWIFTFGTFAILLVAIPLFYGHFTFDTRAPLWQNPSYLSFVTNPILWEFIIGVGIGLLYVSKINVPNRWIAKGILGIAICLFVGQYVSGIKAGFGILGWGLSSSLLMLSLTLYVKTNPLPVPRFAVFLGTISYSLYLTHLIVQVFLLRILEKLQWSSVWYQPWYGFVYLGLVLLCAYGSYVIFEMICTNWLKRVMYDFFKFKKLSDKHHRCRTEPR